MFPVAEIGAGEVLLALIPTLNVAVLAVVWKLTGKVQSELVGQTEEVNAQVTEAQEVIQTDLRNGIRDRLDRVEGKLDHLMRKEKKDG